MINYNENENEKVSHRYDINTPRPRHGHPYTKYKEYKDCLSMTMLTCIEHHLSNTWSSSNTEAELKKAWHIKKARKKNPAENSQNFNYSVMYLTYL